MRSRAREASCSGKGVFRGYILLHGNEHVFRGRAGKGRLIIERKCNATVPEFLLDGTGHDVL